MKIRVMALKKLIQVFSTKTVVFIRTHFLLQYFRRGCPLDEQDLIDHDSPLHLATRHANNEMVAILLRKGANTDAINKVIRIMCNTILTFLYFEVFM